MVIAANDRERCFLILGVCSVSHRHDSLGSSGRTEKSRVMRRTLLDGFLGQIHEHCGVRITDAVHHARRYLHFLAGKPVPGLDDELTNRPALVVRSEEHTSELQSRGLISY